MRQPALCESDLLNLFTATTFASQPNWPPRLINASDSFYPEFYQAPPCETNELVLAYKVGGKMFPWPYWRRDIPTTIQVVLGKGRAAIAKCTETSGLCGPGDIEADKAPEVYAILAFQYSAQLFILHLIGINEANRRCGNMTTVLVNLFSHPAFQSTPKIQLTPCHPNTIALIANIPKAVLDLTPGGYEHIEVNFSALRERVQQKQKSIKAKRDDQLLSEANCTLWLVRNGFSVTPDQVAANKDMFTKTQFFSTR